MKMNNKPLKIQSEMLLIRKNKAQLQKCKGEDQILNLARRKLKQIRPLQMKNI